MTSHTDTLPRQRGFTERLCLQTDRPHPVLLVGAGAVCAALLVAFYAVIPESQAAPSRGPMSEPMLSVAAAAPDADGAVAASPVGVSYPGWGSPDAAARVGTAAPSPAHTVAGSVPLSGQVFKCVDGQGRAAYSNVPMDCAQEGLQRAAGDSSVLLAQAADPVATDPQE